MVTPKRRREDAEEDSRQMRRGLPHYVLYPILGSLVGLGSPLGAFLMRYWLADPVLKSLWIRNEFQYNFLFYAYMAIGSVAAFLLFGYFIGLKSERQRVSNRTLQSRLDDLHLKSVTDALTGTFTHGYLKELLEIEIQHSLTHKTPLSALMLDIDDFKRINDNHGHLFGDRVVKETAETISANIRAEDILGRYGGDEFLVIMPSADAGIAARVAERICHSIAKNGYLATVSIGTATIASHHEIQGAKDILHVADTNLYEAKRTGKNRVITRASGLTDQNQAL